MEIVMFISCSKNHCDFFPWLTLRRTNGMSRAMKYYYSYEYHGGSDCSSSQSAERDAVAKFLDGEPSEAILGAFARQIVKMTAGRTDGWEICFVPEESMEATERRYSTLASNLRRRTGVVVRMDALSRQGGRDARKPEFVCPKADGSNVILIGGLVDTGRTINAAAAALMGAGARSVTGLVAGKTVA